MIPEDYEPVADRVAKFWVDHPTGNVLTEMVTDNGVIIFKAEVWRAEDQRPMATGFAHQRHLSEPPTNKFGKPNEFAPEWTSPYEVCETSAVGRALANAGYAAKDKRPSREEMEKAHREVERIDSAQAAVLIAALDHIGHYPDAWKVAQLPTRRDIESLPVSRFEEAHNILVDGQFSSPGAPSSSGETGGGDSRAEVDPAPQILDVPLPPINEEEKRLLTERCADCESERSNKILGVNDRVICEDRKGCKDRAAKLEQPF